MARFIKKILGIIESFMFFIRNSRGLFVINYHGTPSSVMDNFEEHLDYYMQNFNVISPDEFVTTCSTGKMPYGRRPSLLMTFDDGMKNNLNILSALEQRNIRAFFFVIPAFIDSPVPREYLSTVIRPGYSNSIETEENDFLPMGWDDLKELLTKGHKIGSHTFSHSLLRNDPEDKSGFEIIESRKLLEQKLSVEVPYFCSINNTDHSIGPVQEAMVRKNYDFHFTTYYGDNLPQPDSQRIQRTNVEAYWNLNEVRYALGSIRKFTGK
jgi:peptidoglycan/xylan/chitin deacetylase (PgdA/CDA1 family)